MAQRPASPATQEPLAAPATLPLPGRYADADPGARSVGLIAYAMHVEAALAGKLPPDAEQRFAAQADALFRADCFRYLHNRVDAIRQEAAAEALAGQRSPPGFVKLVLAALVAIALAGAGTLAVTGHWPDAMAQLRARMGAAGP